MYIDLLINFLCKFCDVRYTCLTSYGYKRTSNLKNSSTSCDQDPPPPRLYRHLY